MLALFSKESPDTDDFRPLLLDDDEEEEDLEEDGAREEEELVFSFFMSRVLSLESENQFKNILRTWTVVV